jgi:polysaccharide pyruvyl transferase WcaK-like protein
MKVVIAGPFGSGALADEAVLAGLLRHLGRKHEITVLSQNPDRTEALHQVQAETLAKPKDLLASPEAWHALSQAHLLVLCGAGVLSERGTMPARVWLSMLEHACRVEVKTAVMGVGALPVENKQESIRLQRLLHNFTAGISVRDEQSKQALVSYGLSPGLVSANGDLALALATGAEARWKPKNQRVGLIFSEQLPSRDGFGFEERRAAPALVQATQAWLSALLASCPHEVVIFHDDTPSAAEAVAIIRSAASPGRVQAQPANLAPGMLQKDLANCAACFSFTLHGLMLSATCGVPAAGLEAETGASRFLAALGQGRSAVACRDGAFEVEAALKEMHALLEGEAALSALVTQKIGVLTRKETQNARMLEYLVPRRERREKNGKFENDESDESDEKEGKYRNDEKYRKQGKYGKKD